MNKRLLWLILGTFVVANILAAIKVAQNHRAINLENGVINPPMAVDEFSQPTNLPTSTPVTKEAMSKIVCPQALMPGDWPVTIEKNQPAKLDLSNFHLSDRERQAIEQSYRQGINLAGHYHLASWSCGQSCQKAAVINTQNGQLIAFGETDDLQARFGWQFSATSSLLIINPNSSDQQAPTIYSLVENQGLRRICYLASTNQ